MTTVASSQVRRLCWVVRAVGASLLAVVLLSYLAPWALPDLDLWSQHWAKMARVGGLSPNAIVALTPGERFLLAAVAFPYLVCLVWAFRHLHEMLRGFEHAEFFGSATVGHLRAFAGFLLLAKALSLFAGHMRIGMYVGWTRPAPATFAFNISSDELALIVLCALIFLIAHMMEEGRRLEEENRSFL